MQNITYQESSQHNIMKVDDAKFGTRDKRGDWKPKQNDIVIAKIIFYSDNQKI